MEEHVIHAAHGFAIRLGEGDAVTVINDSGTQVVDTWAFCAEDPAHFMSMSHSRVQNGRVCALEGGSYVTARRGGGGGAMLPRPAGEIGLGQVIRLLEQGQPLVDCFATDGGHCSIDGSCRLKARLRAAESAFLADLDRTTLADIALQPDVAA